MKYYKRLNQYKASNVMLDMNTMQAFSYGWWCFLKKAGDTLVLNNYTYSVTTAKHIQKVRTFLREMEVPYVSYDLGRASLAEWYWKDSAISYNKQLLEKVEAEINRPRTRPNSWAGRERAQRRTEILKALEFLNALREEES